MKFPHGFKIACNFAEQQRWKIFEKIWNLEKWGGTTTPPSGSLVKNKIAPSKPLLLMVFFLDQKKKNKLVKND